MSKGNRKPGASQGGGTAVIEPLSADQVGELVDERVSTAITKLTNGYRDKLRYLIYGVGAFIIALPIGGDDVVRALHNKAFPADALSDVPIISFGADLELRGEDPRAHSKSIAFYAEKGQRVFVYATASHRFAGAASQRVIVTLDGKAITGPLERFVGGLHEITDQITWESRFEREPNVHRLGFSLDDSQMIVSGEVTVGAVVLVYTPK